MGRHSNSKRSFSLSGGALAALIALFAIVALLVWIFWLRPDESLEAAEDDKQCVAGDLELPISATDDGVAKQLITAYADSRPVVRDYCVTPVYTPDLAASAVHIFPNNPADRQKIELAERTAATSEATPVAAGEVGVAGMKAAEGNIDVNAVFFPVDEQPAAAAVAATALTGNEEEAVSVLTQQRIASVSEVAGDETRYAATVQARVPEGMEFTALGASLIYYAQPLNQTDAVTEEQARAGQDFARFAGEEFTGESSAQPEISESVWAAASLSEMANSEEAGAAKEEESPAVLQPENTLFLFDTSSAMMPFQIEAATAIGDSARGLAGQGKAVGLWNYSSPLSPGVMNGYRENLRLGADAEAVAGMAGMFSAGGQPQTREALRAAVGYAAQAESPTRIVLVTTGTVDAAEDDAFIAELRERAGDKVTISVVHVGEAAVDPAAAEVAGFHLAVTDMQAIKPAVAAAAGLG
ncbi:hypothetical protein [Corynebacterium mayonis]|uniref:hypothetical protein n=1 Tax=Corynebacterium mayonis TaxID=3062461 RepID=UPI003140A1D0